jgi:hypothetical protein
MRADEHRRLRHELEAADVNVTATELVRVARIVSRMVDDARRESYGAGLGAAQAALAGAQNPYELRPPTSGCAGGMCS